MIFFYNIIKEIFKDLYDRNRFKRKYKTIQNRTI